jgi:hypothetical protein
LSLTLRRRPLGRAQKIPARKRGIPINLNGLRVVAPGPGPPMIKKRPIKTKGIVPNTMAVIFRRIEYFRISLS